MSMKPLGGRRKIPHGWRLATLDEIKSSDVDACRAGPFGSSISRKYFTDSGIPVIRGNNLSTNLTEFIPSGFVFVSEERARQKYKNCIVRPGDLVFTCWGTIGQVGHIPSDGPFDEYVISNKQLKLRVDPNTANSKFVYYYLASKEGVEYLASRSIGGAVPGINLGILKLVQIALPPICQQEDIVRTLSAYDDLIESNRRRIQLLEQAARLLYKEWFVHLRFPGHEHTTIHNGLPERWEKRKIADICETLGGGTPSTKVPEYWDGDITWVVPSDITKNDCLILLDSERKITEKGLKESSAKMVPAETILMTSRASVGFFALMDFEVCTNQGFINIIPHEKEMRMYILFTLMSRIEEIRSNAKGTTYPEISKGRFRDMDIVIPPTTLVNGFSAYSSEIIRQVRILKKSTLKLGKARDLLLPRLMNGEVAV